MAKKQSAAAKNLEALLAGGVLNKGNQATAAIVEIEAEKEPEVPTPLPQPVVVSVDGSEEGKRTYEVALDLLLDNPYQPRKAIEIDQELREMAAGVEQYGLLGALPVRRHPTREGYFELAFGHRRREACKLAKKTTAPVTIEEIDNAGMAALSAIENIHRKDLTPLELGNLFQHMRREGFTQEEIAASVKKDRGYVVNRLRLAEAPPDLQDFMQEKPDSLRALAYLIKVPDQEDRALLIKRLKTGRLVSDDLAGDIAGLVATLKSDARITSPEQREGTDIQDDISAFEAPLFTEEGHAAPRRSAASSQERSSDQDREPARVGSAKLRTILRALHIYASSLSNREGVSQAERVLISQIGETFQQITVQTGMNKG